MSSQFKFAHESKIYDIEYTEDEMYKMSFKVSVSEGLLPKAFNPFKFSVKKSENETVDLNNVLDFNKKDEIQYEIAEIICMKEGIIPPTFS